MPDDNMPGVQALGELGVANRTTSRGDQLHFDGVKLYVIETVSVGGVIVGRNEIDVTEEVADMLASRVPRRLSHN